MERLKQLLLITLILLLPACSELMFADSIAVSSVTRLVDTYCKLPEGVRRINHLRWKQATAPNEITITCN